MYSNLSLYKRAGKTAFVFLLFLFLSTHAISNTVKVRNFKKTDYQAASQNWSVAFNNHSEIYAGNNLGLLAFDGVTWKLYPSPNGSTIRAVAVDNSNRVFTGGYRNLGFWQHDQEGNLVYHALSEQVEEHFSTNEEFWNIVIVDSMVYFHAFTGIFVYGPKGFRVIKPGGFVNYIGKVDDEVFFTIRGKGIYKMTGTGYEPFFESEWFQDKTIRYIGKQSSFGTYLIATESKGIFTYNREKDEILPWFAESNRIFVQSKINKFLRLRNNDMVIGTILNGLYIVDKNGHLKYQVNVENGLQSNTVLDMAADSANHLWVALDKGIDFIPLSDQSSYQMYHYPDIGAVYTGQVFQDKFYLGTNQGLYQKDFSDENPAFELVPNTQDQVWNMKSMDNAMFVGHNSGTFLIENNHLEKLSNFSGGYSIIRVPNNPNRLIQSTYSDLVVYAKDSGKWKVSHRVTGFNNLIRYLEFDHFNNLWASHLYQGVYKINLSRNLDSISHMRYFGAQSIQGAKAQKLYVFKIENRVVFATGEKMYTYNDLEDAIVSYDKLNAALGKYASSHKIVPAPGHQYWFISQTGIACFKITANSVDKIKEYPIALFQNELVPMYENIVPMDDGKALVCLESGYAMLNTEIQDNSEGIKNHALILKEVLLSTRAGNFKPITWPTKGTKVSYNKNSLKVRYAFPVFSAEPIRYQYKIVGLSDNWSARYEKPIFTINRIPPGSYVLHARATNPWGHFSQEHVLKFTVLPPIYRSKVAYAMYLVLMVATALLFRNLTVRKVKRREEQKQKEKEKELIQLRNEKLRDELTFKSQQLANSTMGIIKKNEFLLSLKEKLRKQKNDLGTRYPDKYYQDVVKKIDNNITGDDDWKIFEANFEQAHETFLLTLKNTYPDLTSSDLKLCAYLRINLTSKEIAPLLGISVRGVENHRYRLRKKLDVPPDTHLTDFILSV